MKKTGGVKKAVVITAVSALSCIIFLAVIFLFPMKASAEEYISLSKEARYARATDKYEQFYEKPNDITEVLVSFDKVNTAEISEVLPENCEVISAFHSFTYGDKTVSGGYIECEGKTVEEIADDYFDEIYGLVVGAINRTQADIQKVYDQVALDYSGTVTYEEIGLSEDLQEMVDRLMEKLDFYQAQKDSLDAEKLGISGIRIIAANSDIQKLIESNDVWLVEILDFDDNSKVAPMLKP